MQAMTNSLKPILAKLVQRQNLSTDEASFAMQEIMEGRASSSQMAGFLIALSMKGEDVGEIVGLAKTMRAQAVRITSGAEDCFDTCGTGGDSSNTFNVSTLAAVVLAGCGLSVAKHGNRSVSSNCGSADLLEGMGVNVEADVWIVEECFSQLGMAFLYAPIFHPSMRHIGPTRKDLGVRTAFNLLGPLTNPANAKRQLIGVPKPELTEFMAHALLELGSESAWVVHGSDGLDEISITGDTKVSSLENGTVSTFYVHPSDFGLSCAAIESVRVSGLDESLSIAKAVLDDGDGPAKDFVLMNAAASLLIAGKVTSLEDGVMLAREAVASGKARNIVSALGVITRQDDVSA